MRGTRVNEGGMRSNVVALPLDASGGGDAFTTMTTTMTTTVMQGDSWSFFPGEEDPLCTPVLLAIQGISRRERHVALGCGGMKSEEFRAGQVSSKKRKSICPSREGMVNVMTPFLIVHHFGFSLHSHDRI